MKHLSLPAFLSILLLCSSQSFSQTTSTNKTVKSTTMNQHASTRQIFIDKFTMPAAARATFIERLQINRALIKTLPGFIEDNAYEHTEADGALSVVTVAVWASENALQHAREVVQAEYRRQGFDPAAMYKKLDIKMDRAVYKQLQ